MGRDIREAIPSQRENAQETDVAGRSRGLPPASSGIADGGRSSDIVEEMPVDDEEPIEAARVKLQRIPRTPYSDDFANVVNELANVNLLMRLCTDQLDEPYILG